MALVINLLPFVIQFAAEAMLKLNTRGATPAAPLISFSS